MLSGVQRILNARTLTDMSASIEDCEAISPSSLLHSNSTLPTKVIGVLLSRQNMLTVHSYVQHRVQIFWEKWLLLYLSHLQKRDKQTIERRNLRVGDLVLLTDHLTTRSQYCLAPVTHEYPNEQGIV